MSFPALSTMLAVKCGFEPHINVWEVESLRTDRRSACPLVLRLAYASMISE
jgi:hypothetical protein